MQIKDKVNQTLGHVEQYYHQHKRDALKPKIWELIVTIRYLTHEVNVLKEQNNRLLEDIELLITPANVECTSCGCNIGVLCSDTFLYCEDCAYAIGYCPLCGTLLDSDKYCEKCEYIVLYDSSYDCFRYRKRDSDIQVDDYDNDYFKNNER